MEYRPLSQVRMNTATPLQENACLSGTEAIEISPSLPDTLTLDSSAISSTCASVTTGSEDDDIGLEHRHKTRVCVGGCWWVRVGGCWWVLVGACWWVLVGACWWVL